MAELNNIQTFEKIKGNDFKPSIEKFIKVLKRIGVWDSVLNIDFDSLKWKIEDDGMVYFSIPDRGYYKTIFSEIKIRPFIIAWTSAIDKTFKDNWISFNLLIETKEISHNTNKFYKNSAFSLVKSLSKEMVLEFDQTGIYFTNEEQDSEDFEGIRTGNKSKLWAFDYALISKKNKNIYGEKPANFAKNKSVNWIEYWNLDSWNMEQS